mgnify:CR=1 FL=1
MRILNELPCCGTSLRNLFKKRIPPSRILIRMFHNLFNEKESRKRGLKSIPVTLSTRIRLARNISDYPFPGRAETSQKRAVLSMCMNAMSGLKGLNNSTSVEVDDLSELDRQILVEKHLISPELSQVEEGSGPQPLVWGGLGRGAGGDLIHGGRRSIRPIIFPLDQLSLIHI